MKINADSNKVVMTLDELKNIINNDQDTINNDQDTINNAKQKLNEYNENTSFSAVRFTQKFTDSVHNLVKLVLSLDPNKAANPMQEQDNVIISLMSYLVLYEAYQEFCLNNHTSSQLAVDKAVNNVLQKSHGFALSKDWNTIAVINYFINSDPDDIKTMVVESRTGLKMPELKEVDKDYPTLQCLSISAINERNSFVASVGSEQVLGLTIVNIMKHIKERIDN